MASALVSLANLNDKNLKKNQYCCHFASSFTNQSEYLRVNQNLIIKRNMRRSCQHFNQVPRESLTDFQALLCDIKHCSRNITLNNVLSPHEL